MNTLHVSCDDKNGIGRSNYGADDVMIIGSFTCGVATRSEDLDADLQLRRVREFQVVSGGVG